MNRLYTIIALSHVIFSLNAMKITVKEERYTEVIPDFTHEAYATPDLLATLTPCDPNELRIFNRITKASICLYNFMSPISNRKSFFSKHGLYLGKNTIYCATMVNTIVALHPGIFAPQYELPNASTMQLPGIYAVTTNRQETELAATYSADNKIMRKNDNYEEIKEEGTIKIWDLETQQCKFTLVCPNPAYKATYSPDGNQIATQHPQYTQITDLRSETVSSWKEEGTPDSIAYSSDGTNILSYRHTVEKKKFSDAHPKSRMPRNPFDPKFDFSSMVKNNVFLTLGKTITYHNLAASHQYRWSTPYYTRPLFTSSEEIAIPDYMNSTIFFASPIAAYYSQRPQLCNDLMPLRIINTGLHNPLVSSTGELICRSDSDSRVINVVSFQ